MVNMTDTVIGYPEFPYWKEQYCNPNNDQGYKKMNAANWAYFGYVDMFESTMYGPISSTLEHLFARVDPFD